ncbi:hypothetical protein ABZW30_12480 [Kitasatospora sp. NPDC004669]|uniref:hypothetical protein n=1 Tax=Kitasatospora sp. NPDC004669 TaxID=3154555 RepID=UPI0033A9EEAE
MTTIQRRAAHRISAGSAEVARRLGRQAAGASVWVKVVGGVFLWKGVPVMLDAAHHQPLLPAGAAVAWSWAAWRAGQPDLLPDSGKKAAQEPDDGAATEATEDPDEDDEQTEFLHLLHHLMPGTTTGKDDRIHLAQIAQEWTGNPADTAPVRALLAELNIPTTACRVPDRGSSTGIYLRDVPPLPDPDRQPLSGVVAGSDQQQQQQQRSEAAAREGFWIKAHPDHPNRSIIEWENAS